MNYFELVKEQKLERSELDARMQRDADLLYLTPYVLKDSANKAVDGIINVTVNRPAVFGANVVSSLGSATQQCIIESEDVKVDTHEIEMFLNACFASANRRLRRQGFIPLNPFADIQLCFRGRTGRRVLLRMQNGVPIVDIMPWDGRYIYSQHDEDGLVWAGYQTERAKSLIEAEYGFTPASQKGIVLDVWTRTGNEVWIDGDKKKEEPHNYGFCPVVMSTVSLGYGPALLDSKWQKHEGESIFFMIRDIIPELNRLASILQTLNMNQVKAALQYSNPEGSPSDEPPDRPEIGDVISVGKGKLDTINLGDAQRAAQMLYGIMEKAFQEGSYTDIDIGNVRQPFSAVALVTIGENKDMVYLPRLAAKEELNIDTSEMLIKQALLLGGSLKLGLSGHERVFPTSILKGEYSIDYKYFVKSPKTDVARQAVADAAQKWYPRRFIYSDILQVEDPDGMRREWSREEAAIISPGVKTHRIIMDLLEQAERNNDEEAAMEAKIMAVELGLVIDQMKMGVMPKPSKPGLEKPPIVPLLGEGGQIGGLEPNKVASQLQEQPPEVQ